MRSAPFLIFVILFSFPFSPLYSQRSDPLIRDVRIAGSQSLSPSFLLRRMQSKKYTPLNESVFNDDLRHLLNAYKEKNFFLASIDSVTRNYFADSTQVEIIIHITENRPLMIDSLFLVGNVFVSDDRLLTQMVSIAGNVFDPIRFQADMENLLSYYENLGFAFTSIQVERVGIGSEKNNSGLTLLLRIDEGPRVLINKIEFTGQKQTKPEVLYRALRFPLPQWYSHAETENTLYRLRRLTFIESVSLPEIVLWNDSVYGLIYQITEGSANRFDGIAGYVPAKTGSGERGYFTGMLNLSFLNLFGAARRLDAFWQKKDRYSQEFSLAYTEPWFLNFPPEVSVGLRQLVQDTTYLLREYTLSVRLPLFLKTDGLAAIRRKIVDPANPTVSLLMNIPYTSSWGLDLGFEWDSRDNRLNTQSGIYYKASIHYASHRNRFYAENTSGRDTIWIGDSPRVVSVNRQKLYPKIIGMDAEWYIPLTRRWVLFSGIHGWLNQTNQPVIPTSEMFRLGGLQTVRGYFQDQFSGSRVAWNNLEARWLATRDARLFLFLDLGYAYRTEYADVAKTQIRKTAYYLLGYGFGLRFNTRIGLFGLDYGLGRNDNLNTGKIHFGITGQF